MNNSKSDNRSDIAYTDDIIKRVAEELDISEKEVRKIYYYIIEYVLKVAKKSKHISIKLPKLGYLYLNGLLLAREVRRLKFNERTKGISKLDKEKLEVYLKKFEVLQKYKKYIHKNYKKREHSYHFRYPTTRSIFYTDEKSFEEIEDFQKDLAKNN